MRWVTVLLLAASVSFQYQLWLGKGSYAEVFKLEEKTREQEAQNLLLARRNRALEAEVEDLKTGYEAYDELIRSDLGYIEPGEVYYRFVEPASTRPPP
ncbi:MAG: septum formation initiator family protein [Neisseria sp.]|nr:septum formation initiator family protein [Neisseria sp.]